MDDEEMDVDMAAAAAAEGNDGRVFVVREVDFDYDYDAPMFFELGRPEPPSEARVAESWFDSAASCPPSPFVVKLIMREQMLNVNVSPKFKITQDNNDDALYCDGDTFAEGHQAFHLSSKGVTENTGIFSYQRTLATVPINPPKFYGGLRLGHETLRQKVIAQARSSANVARPRSSTLMKPTASQLAKQNQPSKYANSRCQMQLGQFSEQSLCSSGADSQAVKRQKLEGGELCKVFEVQQQADFTHKASKKDEVVEKSCRARLRLTIPREPDLATAYRVHRTRAKAMCEEEQADVTARRFKARPLNRKILEAPSLPPTRKSAQKAPEFQVFHLRTPGRATQHSSASSTASIHCQNINKGFLPSCSVAEKKQKNSQQVTGASLLRPDGTDGKHAFKARPLDKKIFSSKGDIGVFRNEFRFNNERRIPQTPPVDLFSKLSINSERHPSTKAHTLTKTCQPSWSSSKGSKENRLVLLPQNTEITPSVKDKPPLFRRMAIPSRERAGCW